MYFWHIGILTRDIEKTIGDFCALPGGARESWTVMELEFPQDKMVIGQGGRLRAAFARVGGSAVELLQPLDATSHHAFELEKKGPGPHHLAYVCPGGLDAAVQALTARGGSVVWDFQNGEERALYIETADGDMNFELVNICPFMPE